MMLVTQLPFDAAYLVRPPMPRLPLLLVAILGAARVESQDLAACAPSAGPRAECGHISVWENRDAASGRKIDISFAVLRAQHPTGREPIFMFAGGPGQASTDLARFANGPFLSLRVNRDIVLVDQRGTGGSNALTCTHDVLNDPQSAFGHVFDPPLFARCLAGYASRADVRFYTTELAVRDIDDVRARLGYEKVILTGGSYGTRLAQAYMRAYPERVTVAVLDGVVPFDFRAPATYARTAQQSLSRILDDCRANPECHAANGNVEEAFDRLLKRVRSGVVAATVRKRDSTTVPVRMSAGDFAYAVRGILYGTSASRNLPAMIRRADSTGDFSEFAQRHWQRAAGLGSGVANGLHFAIFCAEDIPYITDREVPALAEETFVGRYLLDEYRTICGEWVRAPISARAREPLRSDIPTLLLSGWFDPVTPPEMAEHVAKGLRNSRHLVVRNEAHGAGTGCALPATLYVLREGKLEGMPEVCERVKSLYGQ